MVPRPRVGSELRTRNGMGVVLAVRTANELLKIFDDDLTALAWGHGLRARMGPQWQDQYWEATVNRGGELVKVTCLEME